MALNGGTAYCYNSIASSVSSVGNLTFTDCEQVTSVHDLFVDYDQKNFRLKPGAVALNMGVDEPDINGNVIDLSQYTDMDFTDRIKDCRVDVGAYELDNSENIKPETYISRDYTTATYYVTQNGNGTRSGEDLANAACAEKLQAILDAAGKYVAEADNRRAVVKVAGYASENAQGRPVDPFVYHPNEDNGLSDPDDPQSYTYTVPYGVTLMGGYKETANHWHETSDPDCRDIRNYPTLLSPVVTLSDGQTVNGYHAVTFGGRPDGYANSYGTTTLDGVTLMEGQATASAAAGDGNDKGGGAVVPAWGHVRNCIVRDNTATSGGGLYLQAGATVSGTLVRNNTATYGAGIYAANGHTGAEAPTATAGTYIISSTIAGNTSDDTGGGLEHQRCHREQI